ncbi:MAG TPA: hypothetical protein PLF81_01400 [Candidatus Anammoximicrobium sp.]|nr:hypothetical protein [Candidatus Anammoximicrobium sp.]
MIPRRVLTTLVFALPLMVFAFAVLMGAAALTQAMQDEAGARVLRWIAAGVLVLAVTDMLLLLCVLGLKALRDDDTPDTGDE